jgi:hypothetical protein
VAARSEAGPIEGDLNKIASILGEHIPGIKKVLDDWAESSWGREPPDIETCRKQIAKWSTRIAQILPKVAIAQSLCEEAWLELFKQREGGQSRLMHATDSGKVENPYDQKLDEFLSALPEGIEEAKQELERAELLVRLWRTELDRVGAKKRQYEFWLEYHLVKDEAERLAFQSNWEYGVGIHSVVDVRRVEERIRRINRSLPPGTKPIPNVNPNTIMYVPGSIPGQYVPFAGQHSRA